MYMYIVTYIHKYLHKKMMASNCAIHTYTYQPPQDHDLKLATSSSLAPSLSCAAICAQRARKSRDLSRNGNRGTDTPKLTLSFEMLQNPAESHAHKRHGEKPYTYIYCTYSYLSKAWWFQNSASAWWLGTISSAALRHKSRNWQTPVPAKCIELHKQKHVRKNTSLSL